MGKHIETKKGLRTLLERLKNMKEYDIVDVLPDYDYWVKVVEGCIKEGLAMDEVDWDNSPKWFRPLWKGLK